MQRTWGWHAHAQRIQAPTPAQGSKQFKPPRDAFHSLAPTPLALVQMLDFCGKHNVTCDIELIKVDYVNEAMVRCCPGRFGVMGRGRDGRGQE